MHDDDYDEPPEWIDPPGPLDDLLEHIKQNEDSMARSLESINERFSILTDHVVKVVQFVLDAHKQASATDAETDPKQNERK